MAPSQYTQDDLYSSDGSDDEAPEEVTLSSAKNATLELERKEEQIKRVAKEALRRKNQLKDKKSKEAKAELNKKRKAVSIEQEQAASSSEESEDEDVLRKIEEPQASTSKHSYLDPSLFEQAAEVFRPQEQARPGQGKRAAKKAAREQKRSAKERREEREAQVGEGGSRQVGDVTIQHLTTSKHTPASLATTALPSHTSAAKFITSRLYSKKRQVAVLDKGALRPIPEDSRKRKKNGKKGMSEESKILLGLGMDDGAKDAIESEQELRRKRKRTLLLQAQGQRKKATIARPLASARNKPAAVFAVAKRDR